MNVRTKEMPTGDFELERGANGDADTLYVRARMLSVEALCHLTSALSGVPVERAAQSLH